MPNHMNTLKIGVQLSILPRLDVHKTKKLKMHSIVSKNIVITYNDVIKAFMNTKKICLLCNLGQRPNQ